MRAQPATARQLAYLDRLRAQRDLGGLQVPRHFTGLTISAADELIRQLEQQPVRDGWHPPAEPRTVNGCTAGMYDIAGDVFRLKPTRDGGGLYAQQRTSRGWEYAPEALRRLLPCHRRPDLEHAGG